MFKCFSPKRTESFGFHWTRKHKSGIVSALLCLPDQAPNKSLSLFWAHGSKGWNENKSAQVTVHPPHYKNPHSFFYSWMVHKLYLSMGLSQPSRLFSGRRVVKRKVSDNSAYRSCFTEINKIKLCWEERGHIHFPEEVTLTQKEKKCCFPLPVPWKLLIPRSYCFQKKKRLVGNSGIPLSRWLP